MMIDKYLTTFKPRPRLETKYNLYSFLILFLIWLSSTVMLYLILHDALDTDVMETYWKVFFWITISLVALFLVLIPFIHYYYKSVTYEIVQDEIHVFRGIITKTRKIVPYRTITNLDVKQGIFDRMFNLGTIEIQTAGYSANKTGPEERMDGLPAKDVEQIQKYLIGRVRAVRGSAGAITHDSEDDDDVLVAILKEIRTLREYLVNK